ncbi:WAP four-disulfide core domain protein 3-like, partial [Puntigrus tetrazona]|uniref:WAP four-disulfide core domain protein 3-like n=1 Tax=Puntigrus tetrazona TaxID=1606681 RepID=UPI001C8AC792
MSARAYCSLIAVLLCLCRCLSITDATRGRSKVTGFCPARLTVVPSRQGCSSDRDCSRKHICCRFDRGPVCVPPVSTKPGECPPAKMCGRKSCTSSCGSDSCCPGNEKCCSNGCGHHCTDPYIVKPGQCPRPTRSRVCDERCFHDGQCPARQKCCPTTCGRSCSKAFGQGRGGDQGDGQGRGGDQGDGQGGGGWGRGGDQGDGQGRGETKVT